MSTIGIIGAGAWGTALAQVMATADREVTLWAREPEIVSAVNERRENTDYLPGIPLHEGIRATDSLSEAAGSDVVLLVTPAQYVRKTLSALRASLGAGQPLVVCAKGIELNTGLLMSQVVEEEAPDAKAAILTGPTFAKELGAGLPSAVTIGCADKETGEFLIEALSTRNLRAYLTTDITGAQLGGAIKNVIAIACGVIYGLGMGESARAALVTRGLAEMARLANAMGAKKETLMGMCGMGDLMLTCSSMQSRNYSLGVALGRGQTREEILAERGRAVTEGIHTAEALMVMARNHAVDMPIAESVHACLNEGKGIHETIDRMLERPLRPEDQ